MCELFYRKEEKMHDGFDREMYIHGYEYKTIYVKNTWNPLEKASNRSFLYQNGKETN